MTAAELMAELANNPDYQRQAKEKEEQRVAIEAKLRQEEATLVKELVATGIQIVLDRIPGKEYSGPPRSISDLVNTNSRYPEAISVLLKHLQLPYSRPIKKSIVRALTTPDAIGCSSILMDLFEAESDGDSEMKALLGAAIAESATPNEATRVVELAKNPSHGRGRSFLPLALVHCSAEYSISHLESWRKDPVLGSNARKAIKLLGRKQTP